MGLTGRQEMIRGYVRLRMLKDKIMKSPAGYKNRTSIH